MILSLKKIVKYYLFQTFCNSLEIKCVECNRTQLSSGQIYSNQCLPNIWVLVNLNLTDLEQMNQHIKNYFWWTHFWKHNFLVYSLVDINVYYNKKQGKWTGLHQVKVTIFNSLNRKIPRLFDITEFCIVVT
jgi:hypothetical protein